MLCHVKIENNAIDTIRIYIFLLLGISYSVMWSRSSFSILRGEILNIVKHGTTGIAHVYWHGRQYVIVALLGY